MSLIRLDDVFKYANQTIHIIGCGATGSNLAYQLAKSGCSLILWDDDEVSNVNLSNQFFQPKDVGSNKAKVLALNLELLTGNIGEFIAKEERITEENIKRLAGYVFICVDHMDVRKMLWNKLQKSILVNVIIDIRMGINEGRIYCVNLRTKEGVETYSQSMYDHEQVDSLHVDSCHKTSVGSTAIGLASYATWMFYQIVQENVTPDLLEIMFNIPDLMLTKND